MPKFRVAVEEETVAVLEVEADTEDQAVELAEEVWLDIVAHNDPGKYLKEFSVPERSVWVVEEPA